MPVNLKPIDNAQLAPIAGVDLSYACAGIKKPGRKDVLVIRIDKGNTVAGVFTQNRFCAAPVQICKQNLDAGVQIRALVINTGNANAGTGESGRQNARAVCEALAKELDCLPEQILPFSTGVILEPLPVDKIVTALPTRQAATWADAAEAIMTTDIAPKATSRTIDIDGHAVNITGIAKGAGMIRPNMATMLGFVATDANLAPVLGTFERVRLQEWLNFVSTEIHGGLGWLFNEQFAQEVKAQIQEKLFKRFAVLCQTLERQDFLLPSGFSVADAYLFTVLRWAPGFAIDLDRWPALAQFQARIGQRPSVSAALAAELA